VTTCGIQQLSELFGFSDHASDISGPPDYESGGHSRSSNHVSEVGSGAAQRILWRKALTVEVQPSAAFHPTNREQHFDRGVTPQCPYGPGLCDPQVTTRLLRRLSGDVNASL
jgi:hypothetical protein